MLSCSALCLALLRFPVLPSFSVGELIDSFRDLFGGAGSACSSCLFSSAVGGRFGSALAFFARVRVNANPSSSSSYATCRVSYTIHYNPYTIHRNLQLEALQASQPHAPGNIPFFRLPPAFVPTPAFFFPCFPLVTFFTGSFSCETPFVNTSSLSASRALVRRPFPCPHEDSGIICGFCINCSGARGMYAVIDADGGLVVQSWR